MTSNKRSQKPDIQTTSLIDLIKYYTKGNMPIRFKDSKFCSGCEQWLHKDDIFIKRCYDCIHGDNPYVTKNGSLLPNLYALWQPPFDQLTEKDF